MIRKNISIPDFGERDILGAFFNFPTDDFINSVYWATAKAFITVHLRPGFS